MKAVTCHQSELSVVDIERPQPEAGQILVRVLRNGICGSDLHVRLHSEESADYAATIGYQDYMRPEHSVVLGHEFVGEVVEYGPKTKKRWKPGQRIVALPVRGNGSGGHLTGLSEKAPGAYAEYVVVEAGLSLAVPDDLDTDVAAFTEPLAVAWHAVQRGKPAKNQPTIVIGCGPIGLAVILALKARGVRHVIASDYSPYRRELATACGADRVVDPAVTTPWQALDEYHHYRDVAEELGYSISAIRKVDKLPIPWWQITRFANKVPATPPPVVFECVGVPGVIDEICRKVPRRSKVVVVGVCMQDDTFFPAAAINGELELDFVLGYEPNEFRDALLLLAKGTVDPRPLLSGVVGLDGVAEAFDQLGNPEKAAKILIDPTR